MNALNKDMTPALRRIAKNKIPILPPIGIWVKRTQIREGDLVIRFLNPPEIKIRLVRIVIGDLTQHLTDHVIVTLGRELARCACENPFARDFDQVLVRVMGWDQVTPAMRTLARRIWGAWGGGPDPGPDQRLRLCAAGPS